MAAARLKVAFAGTPEFARVALAALVAAGHELPLVLTQPDRPAGRGLKLQPSPVKLEALKHGLTVLQPRSLRLDGKYPDDARAAQRALLASGAQVWVVAAYGLILPAWALDCTPRGCVNIHGSLLPRWRGAAPIQRAIEAGDAQTGITLMQMDEGLDTGPMIALQALPIDRDDSSATLHDKLSSLGARLLVQQLPAWVDGSLVAQAQPPDGASYAHKIDKAEAAIDWAEPAAVIERRVRAFDPFPGASFGLGGETVKLWRARVVPGQGAPGLCLPGPAGLLRVACGEGALELLELQRTGGRRVPVADFLRGHEVPAGTLLGGRSH